MMDLINTLIADGGGVLALTIMTARFFAKMIPDSATGPMGLLRKVMKILGAYTENKK